MFCFLGLDLKFTIKPQMDIWGPLGRVLIGAELDCLGDYPEAHSAEPPPELHLLHLLRHDFRLNISRHGTHTHTRGEPTDLGLMEGKLPLFTYIFGLCSIIVRRCFSLLLLYLWI